MSLAWRFWPTAALRAPTPKAFSSVNHLMVGGDALDPDWIHNAKAVGITAGASAPAELVEEVIARLRELTRVELSVLPGVTENVRFRMPLQLADVAH